MGRRQPKNTNRVNSSVNPEQQAPPPSINQVLQQDELQEIILGYAIRNNNGSVCYPMVRSIRLVQKSWLRTSTKLLLKKLDPLFILELTKQNSVNGTPYVRENGKLLDNFVNSVTSDTRLDTCVPPFCLKIKEDFFRQENRQSFSDLLLNCGAGLVELELFVAWKGGSLTSLLPLRVNLPRLKTLTVNLTDVKLKKFANGEVVSAHNSNITFLIHYLLNAAEALTEFKLPFHSKLNALPSGFDLLSFPSTLTKLGLECKPGSAALGMLIRSKLPSLTELTLQLPVDITQADGLVYSVLNNFRTTLRAVVLGGIAYDGPPRVATLFRFPVMEKLETFSTYSINLELEPELLSLEAFLPKLGSLFLCHQTVEMIQKWTGNLKLASVAELKLSLVNDNVPEDDASYAASLDLETMQRLHLTFCNLRLLQLEISGSQTCGLKYMFMEMRQLTDLTIVIYGSPPEMNCDIWDALLIGVSVGFIAGLRANPDDWKVVRIKNRDRASIRMMTALTALSLESDCTPPTSTDTVLPLISDFAFHHAFLQMPRLKELYFQGRFKVSDEMTQIWRNRGNTLDYTPFGSEEVE